MKCTIPGNNVKVFGRAVHALARISDELWFDPNEKGLALRSVNSSRSAYASVFFSCMFFQHYSRVTIQEPGQGDVQVHFKCKFAMKSILPVFRCLTILERNVEKCNIYTNFNSCRVDFQLFCKHGITKTHNLTFQDCEPLQVVFAKHLCPNVLKVQSRVLSDLMIHFPAYQVEITLAVSPLKVCFMSYVEEVTDSPKVMHTEVHLSPDEFDYFQVGVDSEVTFCLKELRGFLTFAEAVSTSISIHFGMSGKPIAFSIDDMVLEAYFVLATLADAESRASTQRVQAISQTATRLGLKTLFDTTEDDFNDLEKDTKETATCENGRQNENQILLRDISRPLLNKQRENFRVFSEEKTLLPKEGSSSTEEVVASSPRYDKFCSFFFGAVSANEDNFNQTLCSLATASDNEEEYFNNDQLSQTF
ncbi:cell cycle checkpoint control protein RAD9B [Microcaecilia unicolor]|uniref:Cell cycle checkpoint control protein n=1 Tax=Microcaecilia unicolor TaxID=1415580 RepID=A0A6P7Z4B6_9AMPH|nr:cell cycle checkpoint control protein RAD9B [Microcaecilia unicolor]